MKKKMKMLLVTVVAVIWLLQGCATTRTATIRDADQYASVSHGGSNDDQVRMGFWRSMWEPFVEGQTTRVVEESRHRQQGAVFHRKAIEAAEATTVYQPFIGSSPAPQAFEQPLIGKEVPSFDEEGFSRYSEEEDRTTPPAESYELNELSSAPFHIRPAVQSGVVQPPLAGQEGVLPVVFINNGHRTKQLVVRQEHGPQYEVNLSANARAMRYLQMGRHYVEVYDQNGRPQKIRDPKREVYRRSSSYRWRDRSWDYTGSFNVGSLPSFIDEAGNQYFGVFRTY